MDLVTRRSVNDFLDEVTHLVDITHHSRCAGQFFYSVQLGKSEDIERGLLIFRAADAASNLLNLYSFHVYLSEYGINFILDRQSISP